MPTSFAASLLRWYRRHRRPFPWRATRDPYRIWVSEVMLQQTRAAAVIPYYERFLKRFPDVAALACSGEQELLECWSGLGYYSRARNMRSAARRIVEGRGGRLPAAFEEWAALPGVGPYTAAAVASIAFGEPVAVLDGNVIRVMARISNQAGDVRNTRVREDLRQQAQALLDRRRPGEFNQAMMELGATVCLPRNPLCPLCPVAGWCQARQLGIQDQLPVKLGRRPPVERGIYVALIQRDSRVLLRRRPDHLSLMPGFWELPQAEGENTLSGQGFELQDLLGEFAHSITHHRYMVRVFRARWKGRRHQPLEWAAPHGLPLTTITKKALTFAGITVRRF